MGRKEKISKKQKKKEDKRQQQKGERLKEKEENIQEIDKSNSDSENNFSELTTNAQSNKSINEVEAQIKGYLDDKRASSQDSSSSSNSNGTGSEFEMIEHCVEKDGEKNKKKEEVKKSKGQQKNELNSMDFKDEDVNNETLLSAQKTNNETNVFENKDNKIDTKVEHSQIEEEAKTDLDSVNSDLIQKLNQDDQATSPLKVESEDFEKRKGHNILNNEKDTTKVIEPDNSVEEDESKSNLEGNQEPIETVNIRENEVESNKILNDTIHQVEQPIIDYQKVTEDDKKSYPIKPSDDEIQNDNNGLTEGNFNSKNLKLSENYDVDTKSKDKQNPEQVQTSEKDLQDINKADNHLDQRSEGPEIIKEVGEENKGVSIDRINAETPKYIEKAIGNIDDLINDAKIQSQGYGSIENEVKHKDEKVIDDNLEANNEDSDGNNSKIGEQFDENKLAKSEVKMDQISNNEFKKTQGISEHLGTLDQDLDEQEDAKSKILFETTGSSDNISNNSKNMGSEKVDKIDNSIDNSVNNIKQDTHVENLKNEPSKGVIEEQQKPFKIESDSIKFSEDNLNKIKDNEYREEDLDKAKDINNQDIQNKIENEIKHVQPSNKIIETNENKSIQLRNNKSNKIENMINLETIEPSEETNGTINNEGRNTGINISLNQTTGNKDEINQVDLDNEFDKSANDKVNENDNNTQVVSEPVIMNLKSNEGINDEINNSIPVEEKALQSQIVDTNEDDSGSGSGSKGSDESIVIVDNVSSLASSTYDAYPKDKGGEIVKSETLLKSNLDKAEEAKEIVDSEKDESVIDNGPKLAEESELESQELKPTLKLFKYQSEDIINPTNKILTSNYQMKDNVECDSDQIQPFVENTKDVANFESLNDLIKVKNDNQNNNSLNQGQNKFEDSSIKEQYISNNEGLVQARDNESLSKAIPSEELNAKSDDNSDQANSESKIALSDNKLVKESKEEISKIESEVEEPDEYQDYYLNDIDKGSSSSSTSSSNSSTSNSIPSSGSATPTPASQLSRSVSIVYENESTQLQPTNEAESDSEPLSTIIKEVELVNSPRMSPKLRFNGKQAQELVNQIEQSFLNENYSIEGLIDELKDEIVEEMKSILMERLQPELESLKEQAFEMEYNRLKEHSLNSTNIPDEMVNKDTNSGIGFNTSNPFSLTLSNFGSIDTKKSLTTSKSFTSFGKY